jgi:hypothetical protein
MVTKMAKNDSRITYYRHTKIITAVQNYQFGMEQVKTPFFSFLSDDDLLLPDCYKTALSLLKKYPAAQFFLGSTIDTALNAQPISAEAQNWPDQEFFLPPQGLPHVIHSYFNWTGALFRTQIAMPLNPDVVTGDYDFILRLAAQHPFAFSRIPCAIFTHHPNSFSSHCGLKLIYPSLLTIANTVYTLRPTSELPTLKALFTSTFLRNCLRIGIQNVIHQNFTELKQLNQVLRTEYPFSFPSRILRLLFNLLRFSPFRSLFLKAFSLYRQLKSSKVQSYLKTYD